MFEVSGGDALLLFLQRLPISYRRDCGRLD
jgi:hypothetical protein